MSLDAATLALVAGELKTTLLDAKIDKIFEPTRDEVLMTLRTRTETHRLLLSARSGSARVCLTKESFENPLTPPGFCCLLYTSPAAMHRAPAAVVRPSPRIRRRPRCRSRPVRTADAR